MTRQILSADDETPFFAFREPSLDQKYFARPGQLLAPSIAHFYESERFRGVDESLRKGVLESITPREARKLALRHRDIQRADWDAVHTRIMVCALLSKAHTHPRFLEELHRWSGMEDIRYALNDPFWRGFESGKTLSRYAQLLAYVREQLARQDRIRIAVIGGRDFHNEFLMKNALLFFLKKRIPIQVILQDGTALSELVESWAMGQYIPLQIHRGWAPRNRGEQKRRLSGIFASASQTLIFGRKDDRNVVDALNLAKQLKHPVRHVEVDATGARVKNRSVRMGNRYIG